MNGHDELISLPSVGDAYGRAHPGQATSPTAERRQRNGTITNAIRSGLRRMHTELTKAGPEAQS